MHKQDEAEFYNPREALRKYDLVSRLKVGPIIQPAISYTESEDVDQSFPQSRPSVHAKGQLTNSEGKSNPSLGYGIDPEKVY
jgi:hypothetical protein